MRLFILALLLHTAVSEYYKETQNFKFSRTSPEDGEKKGFYESQSGNMGGNYEHSRNMDTLAQRQFQDLRSQVGMDPLRMGAGAIENGGLTSVYGSASTSGTVKGGLLQDTQRSRNLDSAANRFDSNRGFYSSANDFGTQNSGMSHNSYNANSQRTLGVERNYLASHGTRFQHGSTTADELSESGSSRTYDNNEARTIRVQPGSKIKVVVRPNNPVKIQFPTKAQMQTKFSVRQGHRSGSQIYESQHGGPLNEHNSEASQSSQSTGERRMGGYDTHMHRNQQSAAGLRSGAVRESSVKPAGSLLSNTARNRDRLLVGTLELDRENSESTRHLKGSETASTGTSYGESGYRQHGSTQSVDSTIGRGYM